MPFTVMPREVKFVLSNGEKEVFFTVDVESGNISCDKGFVISGIELQAVATEYDRIMAAIHQ